MKRSVLLVDDDVQMLDELEFAFKDKNINAMTASTGEECLRLAEAHEFDTAVVDIKLPDCNGVDLVQKLKSKRPDSAYILITAYASLTTAIKAIQSGVQAYLLKPFNPGDLIEAVQKSFLAQDILAETKKDTEKLLEEKRILEEKLEKLRELNEVFIGREERIQELKREVDNLLARLDQKKKYEG